MELRCLNHYRNSVKTASSHKILLKSVNRLLSYGQNDFFCRAMLCISAAYAVMRCLSVLVSVCPSATFVDSVKTSSYRQIFFTIDSHTILVFLHQTSWQYFDGKLPSGGVECGWGRQKSRSSANICLHRAASLQQQSYFLKWRPSAILSFKNYDIWSSATEFQIFICVPNCIKIGWFFV